MTLKPPVASDATIYDQNARACASAGQYAEIRPESPSWATWRAYFREIDHKPMLIVMGAHENHLMGKHGFMVPAEWPKDFDDRAPKLVIDSKPVATYEDEFRRAEVVRNAMANTGFVPKGRRGRSVSREELRASTEAGVALEEAKLAELAKRPVPAISDTARAIMRRSFGGE